MPNEVQSFFQGFNFDTLLALLSFFTGVIALIVGGVAYKQCQINKNSFNDSKSFNENSQDHSRKAGRDIIINECDSTALATLTSANFEASLKMVYSQFEKKTTENLHNIINESRKIIEDNKINLGEYTKIDWINIYFESAKHTADSYMQVIWSKLLVKEIEHPGSFSFKTLDVLKSMSGDDFRLFENLCCYQINGTILLGKETETVLKWTDQIKLKELGLLNLESSQRWYEVPANGLNSIPDMNRKLTIILQNITDQTVKVEHQCYFLTTTAEELLEVASYTLNRNYFINLLVLLSR